MPVIVIFHRKVHIEQTALHGVGRSVENDSVSVGKLFYSLQEVKYYCDQFMPDCFILEVFKAVIMKAGEDPCFVRKF